MKLLSIPTSRSRQQLVALLALPALLVAGCGGDDGDGAAEDGSATTGAEATTTTVATEPLRILVTDDDGVAAEGISALVEGLRALPNTEVTVVAPATDQSGTGGKVTDGPLTVNEATTAAGYEAKGVEGFPADTIIWALDQKGIDFVPDLVISGINKGQNLGPVHTASGTIGAARAAAARGIPSIAVSQGVGTTIDYTTAVELTLDWLAEWRDAGSSEATLDNLNVPTCGTGTTKELEETVAATDAAGRQILAADIDCTVTVPDPKDDVDAFNAGYPTLTDLPVATG